MSKYAPLADYLKGRNRELVPMSFEQVEKVLGFKLPPSALEHRPWWSNTGGSHVQAKGWLDAGFESGEVDMEKRKLVFKRVRGVKPATGEEEPFHPLYGYMKGLVRIMPGVDITQPPDPDLADYLDAKWGPEKRES
jgi:hypothetical protein